MARRFLGLDYGAKTVGVAVSDPLLMGAATPVEIIRRDRESKLRRTFSRIQELIAEYDVEEIVIGLPLNMDGSEGERAVKTREFGEALSKRCNPIKISYFDERLSSVEAHERLDEMGIKQSEHNAYIDKIAAMIILEEFLKTKVKQDRNNIES